MQNVTLLFLFKHSTGTKKKKNTKFAYTTLARYKKGNIKTEYYAVTVGFLKRFSLKYLNNISQVYKVK